MHRRMKSGPNVRLTTAWTLPMPGLVSIWTTRQLNYSVFLFHHVSFTLLVLQLLIIQLHFNKFHSTLIISIGPPN